MRTSFRFSWIGFMWSFRLLGGAAGADSSNCAPMLLAIYFLTSRALDDCCRFLVGVSFDNYFATRHTPDNRRREDYWHLPPPNTATLSLVVDRSLIALSAAASLSAFAIAFSMSVLVKIA